MNTARNSAIVAAVHSGERMQTIADRYGISRQRVEQLVHKEQHRARRVIHDALESGRIVRPQSCEVCQRRPRHIEAHHPDYSKPHEVQWLCRRCHRAADIVQRRPIIEARHRERVAREDRRRTARRARRLAEQKASRRVRWHRALAVLKDLAAVHGRSPTYTEFAVALFRRPIKINTAVPYLSSWLWMGALQSRKRYWARVQALYRLAGLEVRGLGSKGHRPGCGCGLHRKAA